LKCPKCGYLGFETGDRCKHCGYDFSLLSPPPQPDYDLRITLDDQESILPVDDIDRHDPWFRDQDEPVREAAIDDGFTQSLASAGADELVIQIDGHYDNTARIPSPPPAPPRLGSAARFSQPAAAKPALPLFNPATVDDDEPLIKLPVAPRPPLQVRRTPDAPSLRTFTEPAPRPARGPGLEFPEQAVDTVANDVADRPRRAQSAPSTAIVREPSKPGARLIAVAIDLTILLGIDFAILYLTVRMTGLTMGEWNQLPLAPLVTFLVLLKVAYFYAFTAVGGQTIGKMAAGTCVVADDGGDLDAAQAMRRTCAGLLSALLLGLGLLPALFGDRRALHDRLARTRVVSLRSA